MTIGVHPGWTGNAATSWYANGKSPELENEGWFSFSFTPNAFL